MGQAFWPLALLALLPINYVATRTRGVALGKLVLLISCLPALGLVGFSGVRLGYAIINADEVNRRFREGDTTYFGADMAFVMFLIFGSLWAFLAYVGFRWGRSDRPLP